MVKRYNPSTRLRHLTEMKRYADLMGNHEKQRIKSLCDNILWEDDAQTFLPGIKQSSSKEYVGNLDNAVINTVEGMGDEIDILILYGSDGMGASGIYGYTCKRPTATPNETSGPDGVLEMTVTCVPMTVPEHISGTVTYSDSTHKFTLAIST